jgi:carbonic anhydrase
MNTRQAVLPILTAIALATSLAAAVSSAAQASEHDAPHWGYGPGDGPAAWGKLSRDYALCANGKAQTPIDLVAGASAAATGAPPELESSRAERALALVNNGHTIQVADAGGDTIRLDGVAYRLVQFHFHDPSEHTLAGKSYPMEMHLVHQSADGKLAVLGVLIEEGAENTTLAPLWRALPRKAGENGEARIALDTAALLPRDRHVLRYSGSLTTPPCSEGVQWLVFQQPVTLSHAQIVAFTEVIGDDHRPVQSANGRVVTTAELRVR